MEKACAPELNTGMFTAMKEAGDVMGMFVGHDHDNDYAVMWKGILLAYGRFTGGNTEYNHLSNGARVILMKEGARTFTTWIRLKGGEIIDKTVYPDSYMKDDWRKRPLVRNKGELKKNDMDKIRTGLAAYGMSGRVFMLPSSPPILI